MQVDIRPAQQTDTGFIFSNFLRGTYYGNETYSQIEQDVYFDRYQPVLRSILARPTTTVRIATLPGEPDVMIGFAIIEGPVLHYVFVKDPFRKHGVAKQLVPVQDIKAVTHITKPGNRIRKAYGWSFNPFLV